MRTIVFLIALLCCSWVNAEDVTDNLTIQHIRKLYPIAKQQWIDSGEPASKFAEVKVSINNIEYLATGNSGTKVMDFDDDANGSGWYVGAGPNVPRDKVDLLSVMVHELGHVIGYDHGTDCMQPLTWVGTRNITIPAHKIPFGTYYYVYPRRGWFRWR